jgi:RHS repeat-associated protein
MILREWRFYLIPMLVHSIYNLIKPDTPEYTAKEAGYVFMYISNESDTQVDVYFDDVTMTYTPTNVIQYNEYYPFGLQTASSWTRDNSLGNNFLANGGTELNSTSNLYDLDYRNYDPVLGRMYGVDPLAEKYSSHTPYNFVLNDPVSFNDPSGADLHTYSDPYLQDALYPRERYQLWGDYFAGIQTSSAYGPIREQGQSMSAGAYAAADAYFAQQQASADQAWALGQIYGNNNVSVSNGVATVYSYSGSSYYSNYGNMSGATSINAAEINLSQQNRSGSSDLAAVLNKGINDYGFVLGTVFGGFETGFEQGVKSLERVRVITGVAKNGAYLSEIRNAVTLSNKSIYSTAVSSSKVLKVGGRVLAAGVVAYNAGDLLINGGTNRDVAKFAVQTFIAGVGFLGPIGFVASLGLTVLELNGGLDWIYDNFDDKSVHKLQFNE